ncbi:unnamed protein product [Protopolystoma xenopodis]|uniref:Uncharacterized protein n=1 Tax=Protopolystoma xenopodis TaxID=117903 RepID=A0A3S5BAC2_9PLAT|nr:unnamed protein product [Protopolystoma xenopodis]
MEVVRCSATEQPKLGPPSNHAMALQTRGYSKLYGPGQADQSFVSRGPIDSLTAGNWELAYSPALSQTGRSEGAAPPTDQSDQSRQSDRPPPLVRSSNPPPAPVMAPIPAAISATDRTTGVYQSTRNPTGLPPSSMMDVRLDEDESDEEELEPRLALRDARPETRRQLSGAEKELEDALTSLAVSDGDRSEGEFYDREMKNDDNRPREASRQATSSKRQILLSFLVSTHFHFHFQSTTEWDSLIGLTRSRRKLEFE